MPPAGPPPPPPFNGAGAAPSSGAAGGYGVGGVDGTYATFHGGVYAYNPYAYVAIGQSQPMTPVHYGPNQKKNTAKIAI